MSARPMPECIYHYTSNSALMSILKHEELWMSARHHLNDTQEGKQFFRLLRDEATDEKIAQIKSALNDYEFFVTCFSADQDSLSQWRGYAENGAGVAIGFSTAAIKKMIEGSLETFLYPVCYADEFKKILPERQNSIRSMLNSPGVPSKAFIKTMTYERWAIKPEGFHEEKEWRLIVSLNAKSGGLEPADSWLKIFYAATSSSIREYCKFSFEPQDLVKSITLGPNNRTDVPTLERHLRRIGLAHVQISESGISYRESR